MIWQSASLVSTKKQKQWRIILFNNTFNTFYKRFFGAGHMIKDHYGRKETRCHHLSCCPESKVSITCTIAQARQDIHQSCSNGWNEKLLDERTMRNRSDDTSYHDLTFYHQTTSCSQVRSKGHINTSCACSLHYRAFCKRLKTIRELAGRSWVRISVPAPAQSKF